MTRDDIIRMAREAGLTEVVAQHGDGTVTLEVPNMPKLERFAELVAVAERQRCAKVCEAYAMPDGTSETALALAAAIRSLK